MSNGSLFGGWVKRRRRALGLTQNDLAQQVACSHDLIKKIEAGTRRPSVQIARRLATFLDIPPAEHEAFLHAARPDLLAAPPLPLPALVLPPLSSPAHRATPLIGREREVEQLLALLRAASTRLLTLTGPGGIGKTRLSQQVLALLPPPADGAAFVSLASISAPALVLPTIAQALGVKEQRDRTISEALLAWLGPREMLLVLDNFEQVLLAAPDIAALLQAAPRLRLLVTSRAALRLPNEREFAVAPLALPDLQAAPQPAALLRSPAVALFVERARAAQPAFALSEANARPIAQICARLDGLPLAIELAAARIATLSAPALLARLAGAYQQGTLDVLGEAPHDLPDRQRTMRSTIAWSYLLLDATQQQVFRRMGVFVGGGTAEAAAAVCANIADLPAQLAALASQSLLHIVAGADGQARFAMLETLREFALERLAEAGELAETQRRHAQFFVKLAEAGEPAFRNAAQPAWLRQLETEHDNLRAALSWSYGAAEQAALGFRLVAVLWQFWLVRGYVSEGRSWIAGLLARETSAAATPERACALNGAGLLAWSRNDFRAATALLEQALAAFTALGDAHGRAWALNHLGQVELAYEHTARAITLFDESLALFRAEGAVWNMGWTLLNLGLASWARADHEQAERHFAESLALFRQTGEQRGIAWALEHLGRNALLRGDTARAHQLLSESLALFRAMHDQEGSAWLLEHLGRIALARSNWHEAAALFGESLQLARSIGHAWGIGRGLVEFAGMALLRGQPERAAQLVGAAESIFSSFDGPMELADQAHYEDTLATICASMPPALFAAARAAGQKLASAQAIAYALAQE